MRGMKGNSMILAARCMAAETSKGIVTCACALDIHLHTTSPHIISGGHVLILLTLRPITRLSIHEINSKIFAPKLKLSTTIWWLDRNLTYISHFVAWESQSEEEGGNGWTMVEQITLLQARRSKNYASARRRTA